MYLTHNHSVNKPHLDGELLLREVINHHEELLVEHRVVAALHRLAALQAALTDLLAHCRKQRLQQ
jgi:hypothetical protein